MDEAGSIQLDCARSCERGFLEAAVRQVRTAQVELLVHVAEAIGQLLSPAARCLSISTVHGGAGDGGGLGGLGEGEGESKGFSGGGGGGFRPSAVAIGCRHDWQQRACTDPAREATRV